MSSQAAFAVWLFTALSCGHAERQPSQSDPVGSQGSEGSSEAPDSHDFWRRYIGAKGAPGPESLSFCARAKPGDVIDVAKGTTLEVWPDGGCQLYVSDVNAITEVQGLLREWSRFDNATLIDEAHELSAFVKTVRQANGEAPIRSVSVAWRKYTPLEKIFGRDGQLLIGFDVKRALGGKSSLALRDAVSPPFAISESDCDESGCAAFGPSLPGGQPIRIGSLARKSSLEVSLSTTRDLLPRVHQQIEASLGPGKSVDGDVVHERDGIRYIVREINGDQITIALKK